ncbi:MAG: hypothetical protein ACREOJ_04765 [Gemmatimonadaceae bacterium]
MHRVLAAARRHAALAALALGIWAPATRAQAVLGFGDDATTLPAGTVRGIGTNDWVRFEQRFTAPSGASIRTQSQMRRTPLGLELGVTNRLTIGGSITEAGTKVIADYFPDSAGAIHADSARTFDQSGLGDAALWARFTWLGEVTEAQRIRVTGLRVRSAVQARVRIGSGSPANPFAQFGIGTGTGQSAIEVSSAWDVMDGHHFWASVVGRYGHTLPDTRTIRVSQPGDPFSNVAGAVSTRRAPGNSITLEATPRLVLGDYFSIGAQYLYVHRGAGTFTGTLETTDTSGAAVLVDASVLDAASALTLHRLGYGVVFSTIAAHVEGRGGVPVEVSLSRYQDLRVSGGRPRQTMTVLGVRFRLSLWGSRTRTAANK